MKGLYVFSLFAALNSLFLAPACCSEEMQEQTARRTDTETIAEDLAAVSKSLSYYVRKDLYFNCPSGRNRLDIVDYFRVTSENFKSFYLSRTNDTASLSGEVENILIALDHLNYIFFGYRDLSSRVFLKYREVLEAVSGLVRQLEKGGGTVDRSPVHYFQHFQRKPANWPKEDGPFQNDLETIRYYFRIHLKREPRYHEEQDLLEKRIDGELSLEGMEEVVANTDEAKKRFVEGLFRRYLFCSPGKADYALNLQKISEGETRENIEKEIACSRQAAEAFITAIFRTRLKTKPDDKELEEYIATIMLGSSYEDIKIDILKRIK